MTDSEPPPIRSAPSEAITGRLSGLRTALGLLGLALYALLRIAYERFYGPFGLSPDDLGLGYLELLTQAAIGAVLLALFVGGLIWLLIALVVEIVAGSWRALRDAIARRRRREPAPVNRSDLVWGAVIAGVIALLWLLDGLLDASVLKYGLIVGFIAFAAGQNAAAAARGTSRIRRGVQGGAGPAAARLWRGGLAAALVIVGLQVAYILVNGANSDARAVRDGRGVDSKLFGVRLTSWGADAATLSWTSTTIDPTLRPLAGLCLMYLGQSDGTLFVYVPHALNRATVRVPAALATVRIVPGARCRPGVREPAR